MLTERDEGARVDLGVGRVLEIGLPEGATGYRWQLAGPVAPALDGAEPRHEPPSTEAPGAFGRRVFRFTAVAPGSAVVRLKLVQPWDAEAPPVQTFTAHVVVP